MCEVRSWQRKRTPSCTSSAFRQPSRKVNSWESSAEPRNDSGVDTWEAPGGSRSGVTRMLCRVLKIRISIKYVWLHEHPIANQSNCHPHTELAVTSHLHPWLETELWPQPVLGMQMRRDWGACRWENVPLSFSGSLEPQGNPTQCLPGEITAWFLSWTFKLKGYLILYGVRGLFLFHQ